jgi:hypothetical protein
MTERFTLADMGTGPVQGATEQDATRNIGIFILDLHDRGLEVSTLTRCPDEDRGGRCAFSLGFSDGRSVEIRMPGLPTDRVRWMHEPEQRIHDFPRLYVDGGSWIWYFALSVCEPNTYEDSE